MISTNIITEKKHYILFAFFAIAFAIAFLPHKVYSSSKHGPKSLPANRWREVKRFNTDSVQVAFFDTMFITLKPKNAFSYHNKDAFVYNGTYILDGKELDFGYAKFLIVSKKPTLFLLKDRNGYYQFKIDSSDTLKTIVLPKEEKIDSNITIDHMIGHWTVFKRTSAKPLANIDHSTQIKSLIITGPSSDGKLGYIFSDADKADMPSWNIKRFNKNFTIDCEGVSNRVISVIKCQGGELILEDDGIKYFFKQFK